MEQKEPQLYLEADFIREEDEDDGIPEDPESLQQQLRKFREQWQQELLDQRDSPEESVWSEQKFKKHNRTVNDGKKTGLQEEKAKDLYVKGVQAEQKGYLYDAVRFYRQAIQLVPDIEYKINFIPIRIPRERQASETSVGSSQSVEEFDEEEDLLTHFQKLQCKESAICKPEVEQRVSRGFYLCSADEELWRLICVRIWGTNCISCRKYGSWRNMYSQRPHLKYNGCYISKCSYVRQGEKGLDYFYKPWHLVEYYRYLRFFPDGGVVMLSSPEEPTACIPKLKNNSPKYQGMLSGYYRISGNTVTAIMTYVKASSDPQTQYYRYRLNRNNQDNENDREQTFHMEFSLEAAGKRKFSKLCWSNYFLRTYCRATGNDSVTAFELNSKNYPALIFSQVKSYSAVSEFPLH